jgi:hypothetical protein
MINLMASSIDSYNLPLNDNPDEFVVHSGLPSFVSFEFPTYFFLPMKVSDLGISTISGILENSYEQVSFSFKIDVTNEAPYLESGKIDKQ